MTIKYLILALALIELSGCASLEEKQPQAQVIDRLSEEELARIMPKAVTQLSFEALVNLSKTGLTPTQMIEKLKETDTTYDLTPTQILALNRQGVDIAVLDYLHISRSAAVQNNVADVVSQHEKTKMQEIKTLKRQLMQQTTMDPFCRNGFPGFYPYGFGSRFRFGSPWYY